jgi:hypothetical protein
MADYRFVDSIPDLITPEDYASDPEGRRVRLRVRSSAAGVEILGDAQRPALIEEVLSELEGAVVELMLCG